MTFTHTVAEDSSKLALSVLGQLYFLCVSLILQKLNFLGWVLLSSII